MDRLFLLWCLAMPGSLASAAATLAPEGEVTVAARLTLQGGVHAYGLRLIPPQGLAVLNDDLWTMAARGLPERAYVVYQPPTETPGGGLPLFADAPVGTDLAKDQVRSLKVQTDGPELLGSPWAFSSTGYGGGLGVVIERRWEAAHSDVGYDVTRYYDGGDWLSVLNLWGKELSVSTPQTQIVYLLPHGPLALDQAAVVGPAQRLWNHLQMRAHAALLAP